MESILEQKRYALGEAIKKSTDEIMNFIINEGLKK